MNKENDGWVNVLETLKVVNLKRSVKELQDYVEKMRGLLEYHVLTSAHWVKEIHLIEKMIVEREKEEREVKNE